jgi:hypothetical protein
MLVRSVRCMVLGKAPLQHSRQSVDLGGLEPLPVTLACNGCDPSSAVVI